MTTLTVPYPRLLMLGARTASHRGGSRHLFEMSGALQEADATLAYSVMARLTSTARERLMHRRTKRPTEHGPTARDIDPLAHGRRTHRMPRRDHRRVLLPRIA